MHKGHIMDNSDKNEAEESIVRKAAKEIVNSYVQMKSTLNQIKTDKEKNIERTQSIVNQYMEESEKVNQRKKKSLNLQGEKLTSISLNSDPQEFLNEVKKFTELMNENSDDKIIQSVKDRQLKDAKID
jgi:hypothetical protein